MKLASIFEGRLMILGYLYNRISLYTGNPLYSLESSDLSSILLVHTALLFLNKSVDQ